MKAIVKLVLANLIIFAFFSLVIFAYAVDEKDIIAYWPCDEGKGETVADIIGGANGTLMVGPGWEGDPHDEGWGEGKFDKGLAFDENEEWFVYIETNDVLDQLGAADTAFTVAYWIKSPKTAGKGRTVEKGSSGWTQGWHCALVNGRAFSEGCDNVAPGWQVTGTKLTADNSWHHVVHVFEVGKEARIYVDAKLDGKGDISGDKDIAGIGWDLAFGTVGEIPNAWHEFMTGIMDDIAIFGKALDEDEIESVMSGPVAQAVGVTGKLVSSWGDIKANTR